MARDFSRHIYHSRQWTALQSLAMTRTETTTGHVPPGLCERCYQHGLMKPAKVVHHITPINEDNVTDPEVTLNIDNLMRLCQDCHADIHSKRPSGPSRYEFDENGNLVWKTEQWLW